MGFNFSVVLRLRASGAVTVLVFRGTPLHLFSYRNNTYVIVSTPVIEIWEGVLFLMDVNTER